MGLRKQEQINLSDTNISGIGTELDKEIRKNAAATEAAWKGIGQQVGLHIWRIEQFHIKPVPKDTYGSFYTGDSYIVLNTWQKKDSPTLHHDVHFWLGLDTSQDEAGTAAYKTVELDDYLGGSPIQHREVQGFESSTFLAYFPFFTCLQGGVESGFKKVSPTEYKPRLFQVSGNKGKSLVIRQVKLSHTSLNSGDVFILDAGLQIYQWNGSKASGQEKHKSMEFTAALSGERKGAKVTVYDEGDNDALPFWTGIGGQGPVASAIENASSPIKSRKLFQVSDSAGPLVVKEIAVDSAINRDLLKTDDVFILDVTSTVFVWVGSKASAEEKKQGLSIALKYIVENNRPPSTHVVRVLEGGDNQEFFSFL